VAIIASLLPFDWVEGLNNFFLVLFGCEFVLRCFAVFGIPGGSARGAAAGRGRGGAIVLLVIDLVALLSFLPVQQALGGARWLRLFRLTRMALLFGYWAPLVRDAWALLSKGERARQLMLMAFVVLALAFTGALMLDFFEDRSIDYDGDGQVSDPDDSKFLLRLWWAFRQIEDPGNLISHPQGIYTIVISLALTVAGFFLFSFLIGLGTDVVAEMLQLSRLRAPGFRDHTVIVNITPSTRRLLHEFMGYQRKLMPSGARFPGPAWWRQLGQNLWRGFWGERYLVVGRGEDPPDFLRQPELSGIVYRQHADDEDAFLARIDAVQARRIVLLADIEQRDPDAETIRAALTIAERIARRRRRLGGTDAAGAEHLLIAEMLDESNVPAARSACATGGPGLRAFVVPTEKLMALFFAIVLRRPGVAAVLQELLTSHGRELYTYFLDEQPPAGATKPLSLGPTSGCGMDRLLELGLDAKQRSRVVPVGVLVGRPSESATVSEFDVLINPRGDDLKRCDGSVCGVIGIGRTFEVIRAFADGLPAALADAAPLPGILPAATEAAGGLIRAPTTPLRRVLICGFRPGSVYMLEALMSVDAGAELLVLVETEEQLGEALGTLEVHSELVSRGMLPEHHGIFRAAGDGRIEYRPAGPEREEDTRPSFLRVMVADWSASHWLSGLPAGFGHVADLDAVVLVASHTDESDGRVSKALLKLDEILRTRDAGRPRGAGARPRILAEVLDARLAIRLERRVSRPGGADVRVFSIQELRAFFLFQSVVVPGFDAVYAELLGSWGQSFVHFVPAGELSGRCTFADLARALYRRGILLAAVELGESLPGEACVAPDDDEPGSEFDLADLRGAWVITDDQA